MDSVFECGLCLISFDEYSHKPLSLPCGHVFCHECLTKQPKSFMTCPIDKFSFDLQASSLPCCYAILGNLPKTCQKDSCCVRHPKKKVKFLCKSHDKFLCTKCVVEHTGNGHNIVAFTVNSAVVKSELKELETICNSTIKENEESWRDIETKLKSIKEFYHLQINKINSCYENTLKILLQKKKEQISLVSKHLADQCKLVEKYKDNIVRTLENSSKVFHQLKQIQNNLPHYESLCLTIKSLKQELRYLESPVEPFKPMLQGFKTEAFAISCGNIESIEEIVEVDGNDKKNKCKSCSHTNKAVLQSSNVNETSGNPLKVNSMKAQEKGLPRPEDENIENRSPDKNPKSRQNIHSRNHPKRMPWRKRNRSH